MDYDTLLGSVVLGGWIDGGHGRLDVLFLELVRRLQTITTLGRKFGRIAGL